MPAFLKDYNPQKEPTSKFSFSLKHNLNENLSFTPVFSFEFISLSGKELCFNFNKIDSTGYHKLFLKLKEISQKKFKEIEDQKKFYKFHPVDFANKKVCISKHQYKKYLTDSPDKFNDDQLPTLYQFEIFEEKRVFGFLGIRGLFYFLIYDYNHRIYKRK